MRCWAGRVQVIALLGLLALAGCGPRPPEQEILDPHEAQNRRIHAFNKAVDRALLRPASDAWGSSIPEPLRRAVSNVAANLSIPGDAVNHALQGRVTGVFHDAFRLAINSTLGLGGLFDPAREFGLGPNETDFGETLAVWGVREGAYLELPLLGPSTERALLGRIVDVAIDPVALAIGRDGRAWVVIIKALAGLEERHRYRDMIDDILYDSVDSYSQLRLFYLQNRRHRLGIGTASAYLDPYADIYEDPYAQ